MFCLAIIFRIQFCAAQTVLTEFSVVYVLSSVDTLLVSLG